MADQELEQRYPPSKATRDAVRTVIERTKQKAETEAVREELEKAERELAEA